jgi:hypothetical protein
MLNSQIARMAKRTPLETGRRAAEAAAALVVLRDASGAGITGHFFWIGPDRERIFRCMVEFERRTTCHL